MEPERSEPVCLIITSDDDTDDDTAANCNETEDIFDPANLEYNGGIVYPPNPKFLASYRYWHMHQSIMWSSHEIHPEYDKDDVTLLMEIQNFTMNVCQMFPGVKRELLADKISCLMGINGTSETCKIGGWLDDTSSALIMRSQNNALQYFKAIPRLHKILFY